MITPKQFVAGNLFEYAIADEFDPYSLDPFTRAYIQAMLWSTIDNADEQGGEPLENNYGIEDISQEFLQSIKADCERFQAENAEDIASGYSRGSGEYSVDEQAGHDFWLTRVGHGAGFWDGDWKEREIGGVDAGDRLTASAKKFGNVDPYVGDDGQIYGM
jgi:hypothetical protein